MSDDPYLKNIILTKIVNRYNAQLPSEFSALEPMLLESDDGYRYGRWIEGRDSTGTDIVRARTAGITPSICKLDLLQCDSDYHIVPKYHFQYPSENTHRHMRTWVNTYR